MTHWKSLEEREHGPGRSDEQPLVAGDEGFDRRSFLKAAGFTIGAASLAGCQQSPMEKAIPYLNAPEGIIPGRAYSIASTCGACPARCGLLVTCRDGRPIKLEGNPAHPLSRGGLCAVGQASLLELYDSHRLSGPLVAGKGANWNGVDREMATRLLEVQARGGRVRLLMSSDPSPSLREQSDRFLSRFTDGKRVIADPVSASAILDAHERSHGSRRLPRYHFDRASLLVSFDADFLGTWISPVEYTAAWAMRRRPAGAVPAMSRHIQLESRMSLTGTNADERHRMHPHEIEPVLGAILATLSHLAGTTAPVASPVSTKLDAHLVEQIATELWSARGVSLVLCGSNRLRDQILTNQINALLGNYGVTLTIAEQSHQIEGSDRDLAALLDELQKGTVDALFLRGIDPLADLPDSAAWKSVIARVPLVVSFSAHEDETSQLAHLVCPEPHFLESWSDAEPVDGIVSVGQPAIAPLGSTRPMIGSLAVWSGAPSTSAAILRDWWARNIQTRTDGSVPFDMFWDKTLNDGFSSVTTSAAPLADNSIQFATADATAEPAIEDGTLVAVLHSTVQMRDGHHSHNPWLYELPDPITKMTWDNWASLSPETARRLGVTEGRVVRVETTGGAVELPVVIQPGQHDSVVAIPLGYGRKGSERFAGVGPNWLLRPKVKNPGPIGRNVSPLARFVDGQRSLSIPGARVTVTTATIPLASTQMHRSLDLPPLTGGPEHRDPVREVTLASLIAAKKDHHEAHEHPSLWADHPYTGHKWAMAIDLSTCTGCSGCVIACQAENNVPVVGKDEVLRQREMHWIRIDRYYSGSENEPDVTHQPMICHHCENAPCETVCPVLATVHSAEGLNQQVYNRCVGTRYCANNCPYKVRRFNWFDYPHEDRLQNMVLNPDVTVRSRGVMEKCSLCVQRIEEGKIEAKRQGIPVADGAIRTACEQSCPSSAIVFGDANNPKSRIAQLRHDPRHYFVLDELGVRPSVGYLEVVRNREESTEAKSHV